MNFIQIFITLGVTIDHINHIDMKENDLYVSPSCETIELCTQGVIAQSPGDFANPAFFMPFDPEEEELEW